MEHRTTFGNPPHPENQNAQSTPNLHPPISPIPPRLPLPPPQSQSRGRRKVSASCHSASFSCFCWLVHSPSPWIKPPSNCSVELPVTRIRFRSVLQKAIRQNSSRPRSVDSMILQTFYARSILSKKSILLPVENPPSAGWVSITPLPPPLPLPFPSPLLRLLRQNLQQNRSHLHRNLPQRSLPHCLPLRNDPLHCNRNDEEPPSVESRGPNRW